MSSSNLVTIICLITTLIFGHRFFPHQAGHLPYPLDKDTGRNENSTPRTFVLPATPAVAKQQEVEQELLKKQDQIRRCMFELDKKGFNVLYTLDDLSDIDIKIALISFQKLQNIEVTAEFDSLTMNKLGCAY